MNAADPDLRLLTWLADVLDRVDRMPDDLRHAAERAGHLPRRTPGLALLRDTAVQPLAANLRGPGSGPGSGRVLRFGAPTLRIDLAVEPGPTLHLTGLLHDPAAEPGWSVAVAWPSAQRRVDVDEVGRFAVGDVPAGPIRLLVHGANATTATPWFVG